MARTQLSLSFGPIHNNSLFSNHWLDQRLHLEPEWAELRSDATAILTRLEDLWKTQKDRVESYGSEAALEHAFIQPVFEALGWKLVYQPLLAGRKPDYALFTDDARLTAALATERGSPAYWQNPQLLADAKAWHISLDQRTTDAQREYPPQQIEWYLIRSGLDFAILTNGRQWRLIPRVLGADQRRFQSYLECELPVILDAWSGHPSLAERERIIGDFLRFYLFFSPVAYRVAAERKPLIQRAVHGSSEYRVGVGEGLKERVYEALRLCVQGFLQHRPNNLTSAEHLTECRQQSLTLLYRLLFIMYAEDRQLLPYKVNRLYTDNRSLGRFRDDIAGRLDRVAAGREEDFSATDTAVWADMATLFNLIDRGHRTYGVPAYNGGLFDPEAHAFLQEKSLTDWYMARIIDQLSRAFDPQNPQSGLVRVDYRDLAIQHLGGIYEGLLEQHPVIAAEPMVVVRAKKRERVIEKTIPAAADLPVGFEKTGMGLAAGDVYMENDKGERRASGSYYTPDHIVDYIVDKAMAPVCGRINESLAEEIKTVEEQLRHARGNRREDLKRTVERLRGEYDERILALRVVDPAMGSGHFLIRACQYLAEDIATNPYSRDLAAEQLTAQESIMTFWKRRVVERCLYGVDLNPMAVELAKLALWLETVSTSQPLTFLDHHLRCGNSLVGADIAKLGVLPGAPPLQVNTVAQQVEARLPVMLKPLADIRAMPSDTFDQVKDKERLYRNTFDRVRKPFLLIADLWVSVCFAELTEQVSTQQYAQAVEALPAPVRLERLTSEDWFKHGLKVAAAIPPFHWELEFPEVFFGDGGRLSEAGFDVVIGNPPYDVLSEKETGRDLSALKRFLEDQPVYAPSFRGKNNLYKLFVCRAVDLLRPDGRLGFITPMAVLGDDQASDIRRMILERGAFTSVDAFPQKDDPQRRVFREAKLSTAVFTLIRSASPQVKARFFTASVHAADRVEPTSPSLQLSTDALPLYDPANLTIVSCDQADWDLAVRIIRSGRMARLREFVNCSQGEVNETNEKAKGTFVANGEAGRLVTRGAAICLYVVRPASQGEALYLNVARFLEGKSPDTKAYDHRSRRVAWQESSPQNNFRRIIASVVAAGEFCNHTINYIAEHAANVPLEYVIALLNSNLSDWYFRLGSTNAHVSHYQIGNLPCPVFREMSNGDRALRDAAISSRRAGDLAECMRIIRPGLAEPPFSPAVRDLIVELTQRIMQIEAGRGDIARSERSSLDPAAQPYQDLIDRLFYAMAGLSDDEAAGLEDRLSRML